MQLFSCVAYWMCITWQLFVLQAIPVVCVEAAVYCLSLMLWFVVSLVLNSACEVIACVRWYGDGAVTLLRSLASSP